MTLSLRRLVHSHCLRTMAALAWLLLVSTSLAAAPMLMGEGVAPHAMHVASSLQDHATASMQHGAMVAPDMSCCNDHTAQGCNCHSFCGNVLSPGDVLAPGPVAFAATYARLFDQRALAPRILPPLRPPLV